MLLRLLMLMLLLLLEMVLLLVMLLLLLLLRRRRDVAVAGMPVAWAGYALLLRFSQYMLWCRCWSWVSDRSTYRGVILPDGCRWCRW